VQWIDRRKYLVLGLSLVLAVISGYVASGLPLRSEFSNLLPPDRQSVRDLNSLKSRIRTFGTIFVVVDGETPEASAKAADLVRPRLRAIDKDLISRVLDDDADTRAYFWKNRFLFVSLADLKDAVETLDSKIHDAKLGANPLFIDLDDEDEDKEEQDEAEGGKTSKSDELIARLDKAEAEYKGDGAYVSPDGKVHLFILRTSAPSTDFQRSTRILNILGDISRDGESAAPGVKIGLTGNVVSAYYENASIMRGIMIAAGVTAVLIALLLLMYFRAPLQVAASLWSLLVAVLATFALTFLLIGHLNVMSAFLVAIVAGNGINSGLMLLARYYEELRSGEEDAAALAAAIRGAARGTLTAALAAGVAYGALAVTEFRGFRHFGIIGSIGMVISWLSAFTVLPAGLCVLSSWGRTRVKTEPFIDKSMARFTPSRPGMWVAAGLVMLLVSAVLTVVFIFDEPFENDWRNLRSESAEIADTKKLDNRMRESVGRKFGAGLTNRFVVAVDERDSVASTTSVLRAAPKTLIKSVTNLDDLVPTDQAEKLELLTRLRDLTDDAKESGLDDEDKITAERIRPPDALVPIQFEDIPEELSWPFVEKDGSIGKVILVGGSERFKSWSVDGRLALASGVRALDLPKDAIVGGQSFVIADIVASMVSDGPKASGVAIIGAVLAILILLGAGRHAFVTLVAGFVGILGMIALCYLFGLKINFLDLVALPITIGIGIDYSVNLAVRDRQDGESGSRNLLGTTGGAVVLCSLTTIIGYGSLLLSENAGIRSFGLAAMLGELACLTAALLLVPGLLAWFRMRAANAA
jgi:predicted RND superfamily exporter protein